MKKTMILLGTISALSIMAISCQREVSNVEEPSGKIHMTIIASGDAETRTILQSDGRTVLWDDEENLAVLETIVTPEKTSTNYVASSNGVSTDQGQTMTFDVEFDTNNTGTTYTYNALYPNSSYVSNDNTNPESFKVITPTTQKATATSFDGDADLLIAKPVTETAQQTTLSLAFKRMVVVGKMTLNNVKTDGFVKSVKFYSEDKIITGRSRLNLITGEPIEYGYSGNSEDYVEVTYAANDIPANNLTVFFTCLPFEIAAGEKFTVTLTTKDDQTFTREVTIPADRKLSFAVGKNTKFSVDMTEATSGEDTSLAGKDYIIVSRNVDNSGVPSGNYTYMTSNLSTSSTKYYIYGTTQVSATTVIDVTNSKVDFPTITDYWAIEKKGDNYAIKSKTTGKYVSWVSGNSAAQSTDPYELKISAVEGTPGLYKVSSTVDTNRFLQYNGNSGQQRFAFYGGTQNNLFLIPVGPDYVPPTLESIAVSDVTTTSFFVGESFVFDGKVTATYDDETTKDVTANAIVTAPDMTTAGSKEVTVSYTERDVTKSTSYSVTVNEYPAIEMLHFNNEEWDESEKTVSNAQGSFSVGYAIAHPIGTTINAEVTIEIGSDWVTASTPSTSSSEVTQVFAVSANSATGAPRTARIKLSYSNAQDVVFEVSQAAGDDYVQPTSKTVQLTNANIFAAGNGQNSYSSWSLTDEDGNDWSAYAIKNQHSKATSNYHFLQIKAYDKDGPYYIQIPEIGTRITQIQMTVSSSSKPMDGGSNNATLFFSSSNTTKTSGNGVASGTGTSSVTINTSSLNLNTGYITASGAVRIWNVIVTYDE